MNAKNRFFYAAIFFFCMNSAFGRVVDVHEKIFFSGTILSYTALNVPPSVNVLEQFFFFSSIYGAYNKNSKLIKDRNIHQYESITYFKTGLAKNVDINFLVSGVYSTSKFGESISLGDTLILLGFQLMRSQKNSWVPDVRFLIGENFPTGVFDHLASSKNGIEVSGTGSFETNFILSVAKIFPVSKNHAFRFNPNFYYILPSSVNVTGLNTYGGNSDTKGIVRPGDQFLIDFPWEFNITNHLILGMDIIYIHKNSDRFHSKQFKTTRAGLSSSENFSLCPSLEYSSSKKFGIEGGVWFTIQGRNSSAFATPVVVAWWVF